MKLWRIIAALSILLNVILVWILGQTYQKTLEQEIEAKQDQLKAIENVVKAEKKIAELTQQLQDCNEKKTSATITYPAAKTYNRFDTYTFNSGQSSDLSMYATTSEGKIIGSFDRLKNKVEQNGERLLFATNGGIFKVDQRPLGLYVENGKEEVRLNKSNGKGNFFLKPNGIFFTTEEKMGVVTTEQFTQQEIKAKYATQSGPMLVIDGAIHPKFNEDSVNKKLRSGVGVRNDSTAVFVISKGEINFYDFATFFRDSLHCKNALYLDGVISEMYAPALQRLYNGGEFASFITITSK